MPMPAAAPASVPFRQETYECDAQRACLPGGPATDDAIGLAGNPMYLGRTPDVPLVYLGGDPDMTVLRTEALACC